ncbi:hypothetical protein ACPRNU_25060 [Chromobacterium vaccinii]|uniref:hypothetical protein n=1 Tax=Chromobacterium vaccinii TaxID=1108595 RepID=UPI003C7576AB
MSELTVGSDGRAKVKGADEASQAKRLEEESKTVIRQALGEMAVSGGFSLKDQAENLIEAFRLIDAA